jgi:hypothetical protein
LQGLPSGEAETPKGGSFRAVTPPGDDSDDDRFSVCSSASSALPGGEKKKKKTRIKKDSPGGHMPMQMLPRILHSLAEESQELTENFANAAAAMADIAFNRLSDLRGKFATDLDVLSKLDESFAQALQFSVRLMGISGVTKKVVEVEDGAACVPPPPKIQKVSLSQVLQSLNKLDLTMAKFRAATQVESNDDGNGEQDDIDNTEVGANDNTEDRTSGEQDSLAPAMEKLSTEARQHLRTLLERRVAADDSTTNTDEWGGVVDAVLATVLEEQGGDEVNHVALLEALNTAIYADEGVAGPGSDPTLWLTVLEAGGRSESPTSDEAEETSSKERALSLVGDMTLGVECDVEYEDDMTQSVSAPVIASTKSVSAPVRESTRSGSSTQESLLLASSIFEHMDLLHDGRPKTLSERKQIVAEAVKEALVRPAPRELSRKISYWNHLFEVVIDSAVTWVERQIGREPTLGCGRRLLAEGQIGRATSLGDGRRPSSDLLPITTSLTNHGPTLSTPSGTRTLITDQPAPGPTRHPWDGDEVLFINGVKVVEKNAQSPSGSAVVSKEASAPLSREFRHPSKEPARSPSTSIPMSREFRKHSKQAVSQDTRSSSKSSSVSAELGQGMVVGMGCTRPDFSQPSTTEAIPTMETVPAVWETLPTLSIVDLESLMIEPDQEKIVRQATEDRHRSVDHQADQQAPRRLSAPPVFGPLIVEPLGGTSSSSRRLSTPLLTTPGHGAMRKSSQADRQASSPIVASAARSRSQSNRGSPLAPRPEDSLISRVRTRRRCRGEDTEGESSTAGRSPAPSPSPVPSLDLPHPPGGGQQQELVPDVIKIEGLAFDSTEMARFLNKQDNSSSPSPEPRVPEGPHVHQRHHHMRSSRLSKLVSEGLSCPRARLLPPLAAHGA